jgi:hypothetical protein
VHLILFCPSIASLPDSRAYVGVLRFASYLCGWSFVQSYVVWSLMLVVVTNLPVSRSISATCCCCCSCFRHTERNPMELVVNTVLYLLQGCTTCYLTRRSNSALFCSLSCSLIICPFLAAL